VSEEQRATQTLCLREGGNPGVDRTKRAYKEVIMGNGGFKQTRRLANVGDYTSKLQYRYKKRTSNCEQGPSEMSYI